jgi:hypothetical protein
MSDELHLCYLVTPIGNLLDPPDWMRFAPSRLCSVLVRACLLWTNAAAPHSLFNTYQKLGAVKQEIGSAVGVHEAYLSARAMGREATTEEARRSHFVCQRFFTALVLYDVVREMPLRDIAERYAVNRGSLQQLMQKGTCACACACECVADV